MTGSRYTDGEYLRENPTWHVEDGERKAGYVLEMVGAAGLKPRRVCDVGCGGGEILSILSRELPSPLSCEGFDISPQAIAIARKRERPGLRFHRGDFTGESGEACDLLLVIDVVEHVPDFRRFLRDLRGRGARTIFHIPLELNAANVIRRRLAVKREAVGHLHFFTRRSALRELEDAGYRVVRWSYTPEAVDAPRSWKARMMVGPRKLLFAAAPAFTTRTLGGYSLLVLAE